MKRLFWLLDAAWLVIDAHLPHGRPGKPRVDDRRVISGILHVLNRLPVARRASGLWAAHHDLQPLQPLVPAQGRLAASPSGRSLRDNLAGHVRGHRRHRRRAAGTQPRQHAREGSTHGVDRSAAGAKRAMDTSDRSLARRPQLEAPLSGRRWWLTSRVRRDAGQHRRRWLGGADAGGERARQAADRGQDPRRRQRAPLA